MHKVLSFVAPSGEQELTYSVVKLTPVVNTMSKIK